MPTPIKCQAKNPANCRYHGTLENHTAQLKTAYDNYIQELRSSLSGASNKTLLEKTQNEFLEAQGSFDSHDENYYHLLSEVENLERYAHNEMSAEYAENQAILQELKERVILAEKVRTKSASSENSEDSGWAKDYVTYLPEGAKLSSGEIVLAVRRRIGLPASKREVILQNEKGEKRASIWNAHTKVNYLPLEEQRKNWQPNIVPSQMEDFASSLRKVWNEETSTAGKAWSAYRPEKGQCAVTALLVQDAYGGTLNRALVNGESHYWNTLPDGTEVDLTRAQFDQPLTIEDEQKRDREYLFTSEATVARYNKLKNNLETNKDAWATS